MKPGDHGVGATPVPFPNTAVKPHCVDGTTRLPVWESRTLPGFFIYTRFFIVIVIIILILIVILIANPSSCRNLSFGGMEEDHLIP